MDKEQALQSFFSQWGVSAYDVNTVPDDAAFPRITYNVITDNFGNPNVINASIWDRSKSWATVTGILHDVEATISKGGQTISFDRGVLWAKRGTPFAQRMNDPDDMIRRVVFNIEVEYISED